MMRTHVYRFGLCLIAVLGLSLWAESKTSVRQFEVKGKPDLELKQYYGDIEIVAGNAETIQVTWTLHDDQIEVNLEQDDSGKVQIKVIPPTNYRTPSVVDFRIEFPAENGRLWIQSTSGDISLSGVAGELRLRTVRGSVSVNHTSGNILLETVDGNITMTDLGVSEVEANSTGGSVSYADGSLAGGHYNFSSTGGNIRIQHDRSASYEISGSTVNGSIHNNVGSNLVVKTPKYGPGQTISGSYGDGLVRIKVSTVAGHISLDFD